MTENIATPWANVSSKQSDPWHAMCSYLGAFPPQLANYFIQNFTKKGNLIFDPFSGRGTTLLETRLLDRKAIATDLNPIALALSKAKNISLPLNTIYKRVSELQLKYDPVLYLPEAMAQSDDIHLIFHPETMAQLCYLKRKLLKSEKEVDTFIIGCILGILHGGERKDGTSGYCSISMPNTFSMSPEYVRRFVQTKQLQREFRNVFDLVKAKAKRIYGKHKGLKGEGIVIREDIKKIIENEQLKQFHNKVDLILTSPPYLGIVNYAKQNWIRTWFLDKDSDDISEELDDDLNLEEWVDFSKQSILQLKPFLKKKGVAVFVIGDVARSKNSVIPLAREFALMIKHNSIFKNVWFLSDYGGTNKTTRIWGDKKGNATTIDRIVILSDANPFIANKDIINGHALDYSEVLKSTKYFIGNFENQPRCP